MTTSRASGGRLRPHAAVAENKFFYPAVTLGLRQPT